MATQILTLGMGPGGAADLTLDLYPLNSNTVVQAGLVLVPGDGLGGGNQQRYAVSRTGTETGWHMAVLKEGGIAGFNSPWYVYLLNTDGTYWLSTQAPRQGEIDGSAFMQAIVEGSTTFQHAMQKILAAAAGKSNGAIAGAASTINFRDQADTKNRLVADCDADGNRDAITANLD